MVVVEDVGRWRFIAASSSFTELPVMDIWLEELVSWMLRKEFDLCLSAVGDKVFRKAVEECWIMLRSADLLVERLTDKSSGDDDVTLSFS